MLNGQRLKERDRIKYMTKINDKFVFNHNYHSHCELCRHAVGTISEYCDSAFKNGFKEWGVSDHGPLLDEWKSRMIFDEFLNVYLPEIELNQKKYQGKMKILKALEIEYYPEYNDLYLDYLNKYKLDYLILGQHALKTNDKIINLYNGLTIDEVYIYRDEVVNALNTKYFKVLAHPDLFMLSLTRNNEKWSKELDEVSKDIIEACINNDVYIEVNINGARRGIIKNELEEDTWQYPYLNFFRIASQYKNAKFILGLDCHKLTDIGDSKAKEVIDFCNKLNIKLEDKIEL